MSAVLSKPWYRLTVKEALDYLSVDLKTGLTMAEALKRLKHFKTNDNALLPKTSSHLYQATVFRDSKIKTISASSLVIGDIVIIKTGDRVPADIRLIRVNSLIVDESKALGSNVNSYKNTFASKDHTGSENQKCMAFADSFVTSGNGVGVVVETGGSVRSNRHLTHNHKITAFGSKSKLKKYSNKGLFVQNYAAINKLKNINKVVFYGNYETEFVLNTIGKIQLHKNIHTIFILSSAKQSLVNALPGQAVLNFDKASLKSDITKLRTEINSANLLLNVPVPELTKIINIIKQPKNNIMLIISEPEMHSLILSADVSLVVGTEVDDKSALMGDIRAVSLTPEVVASILHNKK